MRNINIEELERALELLAEAEDIIAATGDNYLLNYVVEKINARNEFLNTGVYQELEDYIQEQKALYKIK